MSVESLQREIEEINEKRRDVERKLRDLERDEKRDSNTKRSGDKSERPSKRQAISTGNSNNRRALPVSRRHDDRDRSTSQLKSQVSVVSNTNDDVEDGELPRTRRINTELAHRNKRLFGALLSHLSSAKSNLEHDQSLKRKHEIEEKIEKKISEARQEIMQEHEHMFTEKKEKELKKKHDLLVLQREKEAQLLELVLRQHEKSLCHFIQTSSKPYIFYLPKIHNEQTKILLERCKDERLARVNLVKITPILPTASEQQSSSSLSSVVVSAQVTDETSSVHDDQNGENNNNDDSSNNNNNNNNNNQDMEEKGDSSATTATITADGDNVVVVSDIDQENSNLQRDDAVADIDSSKNNDIDNNE